MVNDMFLLIKDLNCRIVTNKWIQWESKIKAIVRNLFDWFRNQLNLLKISLIFEFVAKSNSPLTRYSLRNANRFSMRNQRFIPVEIVKIQRETLHLFFFLVLWSHDRSLKYFTISAGNRTISLKIVSLVHCCFSYITKIFSFTL